MQTNMLKRNIILDTDIGNDVDDIFALIMLSKLEQFRLLGVTTVYGDTVLQARMVRYVLDVLGRSDVPCFVGEKTPLSYLSNGIILRGSHISGGFPNFLQNIRAEASRTSAVDFLIEQSILYKDNLEIICIGPLTNIATAIKKDKEFPKRITHLTLMGGLFDTKNEKLLSFIKNLQGEYNIICDLEASKIVMNAEIPSTYIPLDLTTQIYFTQKEKELFSRLPFGLGETLEKELAIWWNIQTGFSDMEMAYKSYPHDPMAVVSLYKPELFEFKTGTVNLGKETNNSKTTILSSNNNGVSRVAMNIKKEEVLSEIVKTIIR